MLSQPAAPERLQCFTGWARWSPAAQRCLWRSQMHEAGLQLAELPMGLAQVNSAALKGTIVSS